MDLKAKVLHYLRAYNGRSKPVKTRIEEDIILEIPKKEQSKYLIHIYDCFCELENEGKIKLIPYSEMTSNQKWIYDRDKEPIYNIIDCNG